MAVGAGAASLAGRARLENAPVLKNAVELEDLRRVTEEFGRLSAKQDELGESVGWFPNGRGGGRSLGRSSGAEVSELQTVRTRYSLCGRSNAAREHSTKRHFSNVGSRERKGGQSLERGFIHFPMAHPPFFAL